MSYFTERVFLKERVQEIKAERRQLEDEYWRIHARLKELDEKQEPIDTENVLQNLINVVDNLSKLVPPVTIEQAVHESVAKVQEAKIEPIQEPEQTEQEKNSNLVKQAKPHEKKPHDKEPEVIDVVIRYLRNHKDAPVKSHDLQKFLKDRHGWAWNNFTNTLNRLIKKDSRIKRVSPGRYTFNA